MKTYELLATLQFIENLKSEIIFPLMGFLFFLSFIYFLYGVFESQSSGDLKKMVDGRKHITWGLVGLFVIVAFAGIMKLVSDTVVSLTQ